MTNATWIYLMWMAGCIHVGIILANIPLPCMLSVRENLSGVPRFIQQVFYVHWFYIVLIVGFFAALCFGFARDLMGASPLGRFLSAFMAGFWFLRIGLQWLYYDFSLLRKHWALYLTYTVALVVLVAIFGTVAIHPRGVMFLCQLNKLRDGIKHRLLAARWFGLCSLGWQEMVRRHSASLNCCFYSRLW